MNRYVSFDIELYNEIPEGNTFPDLKELIPSVGAFCVNEDSVKYYWDKPHMSKETARALVEDLMVLSREGFFLFGWNILKFDLPVIAYYSGMMDECGTLAMNCIDPMFNVVCTKGYYLGLDKVLVGAGLESKLHSVTLKDGSIMDSMSGKHAPKLWQQEEYKAVMDYLAVDVIQPLKLAFALEESKVMKWTSGNGKAMSMKTELDTVKKCLRYPSVDNSWMDNPVKREDYIDWIPRHIINKEMAL
jgi:hypothetical protein